MNKGWKKYFGPSTLIAAAFIGPGTLTTCTIAGIHSGFDLLWVMIFAIFATVVLQEMAARLGYKTQKGLGEALRSEFQTTIGRLCVFFLVIGAILIGNAAYEAGNISGGILGAELLLGETSLWPIIIGGICFALLYLGGYAWVEKILIGLVILMSVCFAVTAFLVQPDLSAILKGMVPKAPQGAHLLLVLGLIGTTIVPYNLFLHASTISKKYKSTDDLKDIRRENSIAIVLGGLISILIIITAASSRGAVTNVMSAGDLAVQLEPAFGATSKWLMGIGLLAAGVSSALTAPLAAAYAAKGIFGWEDAETSFRFRAVWMTILLIGVIVAITNVNRVHVIYFAQITNALLLPFVAGYLLYISNAKHIMGEHTNTTRGNFMAGIVILLCIGLSIKSIFTLMAQ